MATIKFENLKETIESLQSGLLNCSLDNLLKEGVDTKNVTEIKIDESPIATLLERFNMMSVRYGDVLKVQSSPRFIFVNAKEKIVQLRWGNRLWNVIAPFDGFFMPITTYGRFEIPINESALSSAVLGHLSTNAIDVLYSHFNIPSCLEIDPFSKSKNVKWGIQKEEHNVCFDIPNIRFSFDFCDDKGIITFRINQNIKIDKGDCISILFDDESIIDYSVINKPIKISDENVIQCTLFQEDIDTFLHAKPCKYRITFQREGVLPITDEAKDIFFDIFFRTALVAYILNYLNAIKQHIPDYQFPHRQIVKEKSEFVFEGCYVYLMKDLNTGCHKIGISNNPEYRERTLQSEKPVIEMVACKKFPTRKIAEAIESALHTAYNQQRLRGEWFKLEDVDVAAIIETLK